MKDLMNKPADQPVLFLDNWPEPPKCPKEPIANDDSVANEVKKWRLQMLLAVNPWGIPSLQFGEAYKLMFHEPLDVRKLGFEHLSEMVSKMPDIFTVQEPDETTALLFPDYANDRILHDARLGHNFTKPNIDGTDLSGDDQKDSNDLIYRAWVDRDQDFPPDVVLAGEEYEQILPMTTANIPGTRGLYQGTLMGVATPEFCYLTINTPNTHADIQKLSNDIADYFDKNHYSIDAYSVPKEFLYPGFPCLVYVTNERAWKRCVINGRSLEGNKILVESVDFGGVYAVNRIHLYLIPRQFLNVPVQAIQACLMGLKPIEGKDWSAPPGSRLRCFSMDNYLLDILLVARRETDEDSNESRKTKVKKQYHYDAIIVDRNDNDMDIYLDEILILETYAIQDSSQESETAKLKEQLNLVLKNIPRPVNPLTSLELD